MNIVLFHSNQLCLRGSEIALYDYAYYNEIVLNNKSIIISDKNNNLDALEKFKNKFRVYLYDSFKDIKDVISKEKITHLYMIKAGNYDNKIVKEIPTIVHSVFTHNEPHGDVYTYVSKNLARRACGDENNYLPHIVHLPRPTENIRSKLGIPEDHVVFGRHGGYEEFNLNFTKEAIRDALNIRKDIHFIFMNTEKFINSERVHFIPATYSLEEKSNFINSTDCMIHSRYNGESFGLSISEFLFFNKPVISFFGGLDKNHIEMLNKYGLWYINKETCLNHFLNFDKTKFNTFNFSLLVSEYTPENVIEKFKNLLETAKILHSSKK